MEKDRYFDDVAEKLKKNVYHSMKGEIRLKILWKDMKENLPIDGPPLKILDAGGGMGQITRALARKGHHVHLCEPAEEMLKIAERENRKEGLEKNITLKQIPIQELKNHYPRSSFDLIIFHGVLEWLKEPGKTMAELLTFLKPEGRFSLLFYNIDRIILKCGVNAMFKKIRHGTYDLSGKISPLTPKNPVPQAEVYRWLDEWGYETLSKGGIRIFYGLFHNRDLFEARREALLHAEELYYKREPYASIAQHIHLVCRKK